MSRHRLNSPPFSIAERFDDAIAIGALSVVLDTHLLAHTLLAIFEEGLESKVRERRAESPSVEAVPSGIMSKAYRNLNSPPLCSGFKTPTPPVR